MLDTVILIIGIILLVMALFLIVSILMQSGKSKKLSGTIAGGAETFFGKDKGQAINKRLSTITNIVAIVFVVLVFASYLINVKQIADENAASSGNSSVVSGSVDPSSGSASKDEGSKDEGSNETSEVEDSTVDASASADETSEDVSEETEEK